RLAADLPGERLELRRLVAAQLLGARRLHQLQGAGGVAALPGEIARLDQGAGPQHRAGIVAQQAGEGGLGEEDVAAGRGGVAQDVEPPVLQRAVGIGRGEEAVLRVGHLLARVKVETEEELGETGLLALAREDGLEGLVGGRAIFPAYRGGGVRVDESGLIRVAGQGNGRARRGRRGGAQEKGNQDERRGTERFSTSHLRVPLYDSNSGFEEI